ncbi:MAG: trxB [Phycisphaerales bacterium]|nr:trxB [Phycisphaerales bacterium]
MTIDDSPQSQLEDVPNATAFLKLTHADIAHVRSIACAQDLADGEAAFRAGQANCDFFVIESGLLDIFNPAAENALVVTHHPGEFSGDIDMLTGRPVIVTAIARGPTRVLRVQSNQMRKLLSMMPSLGEKLLIAFQVRRDLLVRSGLAGLKIVGPASCKETTLAREFLYRNFVPFSYLDSASAEGAATLAAWGSPRKTPAIQCSSGQILQNPSLRELARAAGIWRDCPTSSVDLIVVGAGPAGISCAVYASSEGLATLVLDRLGPGGQTSGSSKIENFIGFPAGLTGADLATRGMLQMLKFGATLVTPINVDRLEPAATPGGLHTLHLDCGHTVSAPAILIASGVRWRKLDCTGAERFERAGVYFACTTVEATLYDNQDVAVVGAGNSAGQAAMFLAECCRTRTVHMIIRRTLGPGMSEYLADRIRATPNIRRHEESEITQVHGQRYPESIDIRNNKSQTNTGLPIAAIFVFIGADPDIAWLPDSVARDNLGYLLTGTDVAKSGHWPLPDREPCPLETSLPGILAAGDVRSGATRRVGFAVGDGSLAVTCVHRLRAAHA